MLGIDRKHSFNYFVIALISLSIGTLARRITGNDMFLIGFGVLCWLFLYKGCTKVNFSKYSNYLPYSYRFLLSIYSIIVIAMIIRGYTIDYRYQWNGFLSMIRFHLFDSTYILPYLMPVILLIPYQYFKFNMIVKASKYFALVTILLFVVYAPQIIQASYLKSLGAYDSGKLMTASDVVMYGKFAFVALCWKYIPSRVWKINLLGLVVVFIALLIGARRGSSLSYFLILTFLVYQYGKNHGLGSKILILIIYLLGLYFVLNSSIFAYIFERGLEDTRSSVEYAMMSQMTEAQKWFGMGLNGRYYMPLGGDDYLDGWRYGIETGFYNIVLKGGYLMVFTYILLLIIPAYKGFFKSNNQLCKSGAFLIILSIWEMFPFGWLTFDVKFLLIWMMIVLCMNSSVRYMTDDEIKIHFFR